MITYYNINPKNVKYWPNFTFIQLNSNISILAMISSYKIKPKHDYVSTKQDKPYKWYINTKFKIGIEVYTK
jgi:hypothetical protein